jgi:hypothetical protein
MLELDGRIFDLYKAVRKRFKVSMERLGFPAGK